VSAALPGERPQSFAMSTRDSRWPIASASLFCIKPVWMPLSGHQTSRSRSTYRLFNLVILAWQGGWQTFLPKQDYREKART
jgi:hypothetical protein